MSTTDNKAIVYWVVPHVIGGMPMPWLDPDRRENLGGELNGWKDELPTLFAEGVRAVVCLLNIPSDKLVYSRAGMEFHFMPVQNGGVPSMGQMKEFFGFMQKQIADGNPVAVHCEAGLGRTGTVIAAWLIQQGASAQDAIDQVRHSQPAAIESQRQIEFLSRLPFGLNHYSQDLEGARTA